MNLKKATKYLLLDGRMALLIFYGIMALVFVINYIGSTIVEDQFSMGMEMSSVIFIVIFGVMSYLAPFKLFLQNGVSRKTMFIGTGITFMVLSAIMAVTDTLISLLGQKIGFLNGMYLFIYNGRYANNMGMQSIVEHILWTLCIYFTAFFIGYFFGILYNKLNKMAKLLVSAGVPVIILSLIVLDSSANNARVLAVIGRFFVWAFGFQNGANPYIFMVACLVLSLVFAIISFFMVRRATVKE